MKHKSMMVLTILLVVVVFIQGCSSPETEDPAVTVAPGEENLEENEEGPSQTEEPMEESPPIGIFQGNRAPDFTLYDMDGRQVCLWDLRGQQVIVNFWQLSCPPCLAEKEVFQAFVDEHGDENVRILSVNLRDSQQQVEAYMEENNYTFSVLYDTRDNFAAVEYGVRATPTSVFIDENGLVKHRVEGMMNLDFIKERVGIE